MGWKKRKEEKWLKMAHKEKVYKGAVGHMLGHYDRTRKFLNWRVLLILF